MSRIGLQSLLGRHAAADDFEATLRARSPRSATRASSCSTCTGTSRRASPAGSQELGLVAVARHARLETIETELPELAAEAQLLGWRRLVVSWVDPAELDTSTLARIADAATAVAEAGPRARVPQPRRRGRAGLSRAAARRASSSSSTPAGRGTPASIRSTFLGRGPLVHVKDFRVRGEHSYCPVGDGAVGYERIVPAAVRGRRRVADRGAGRARGLRARGRHAARSQRSSPCSGRSRESRGHRLRRHQPRIRGERDGVRLVRARRLRRSRPPAGRGARQGQRARGRRASTS